MKLKNTLIIFILTIMLFTLTACSNKEETVTTETETKSADESEELEIDGTGKITLKELVESPKLASKTFSELTMKDLKTFYNANENDVYGSKTIDNVELSSYYSNDGSTTIETEDESITTKNERFVISTNYNASVSMSSKDVLFDEEFPEDLEVNTFKFSTLVNDTSLTEEELTKAYNNTVYLFPYITEHKCKTVEDLAIALGFEETDKSMLTAIKNNVEYEATYESDFGEVTATYSPDTESQFLTFTFEDDTSWLESIEINSSTGLNGEDTIEDLQINFTKKTEEYM